ncbi:tRNA1(Val) (adenine(37)-N6)-methyltransferase [Aestuariivita boseongensis]|uniref:tRNA1(Val) (adenine(37)-N6)-methyltransferase n=1 Tax=Aestuariivita boseongensis TaxID=1470562 RepID=UPI000682289C|nr:methyltransferase [Aestuariivita boseongensis]
MTDGLTRDAYLGGRVQLFQPQRGYRAGVDPVLLAAAVPAKAGQSVLDLGCGVGAVSLCLHARVPGLAITGVELQPAYADLARRNAAENNADMQVIEADLTALPVGLRQIQFTHVVANPPYFPGDGRRAAQDAGRETARGEETPLDTWIDVAARRLAPQGWLHMIQRADRLGDLIAAAHGRLGSLEVLPITGRQGRAAHLVILRARKGGRAPFRLHAPLVMHEGVSHPGDREHYTSEINAILRDGLPMNWPQAQS